MPTSPPSKPLNIGSPRSGQGVVRDRRDLLSATPTGTGVSGSPMRPGGLGIASTPPVPNIPRFGTPRATPAFPSPSGPSGLIGVGGSPAGTPGSFAAAGLSTTRPASSLYGAEGANTPNLDDLPDDEKARVLRRHLMTREEREAAAATAVPEVSTGSRRDSDTSLHLSTYSGALKSRRPSAAVRQDTEAFPVPFEVHGTDVTHDIYKWQTDQRRLARPRSASFAGQATTSRDPAFTHIHEPGGFRRNYLALQANQAGREEPRMLRSFVEFIYVFGHFAGEDLEEIEEEDEEDVAESQAERGHGDSAGRASSGYSPADGLLADAADVNERTPLVRAGTHRSMSRKSRRRGRSASVAHSGDATVTQAVLMLVKGFVGTGILFLGKAFMNGGLLFSVGLLSFIALVSLYSFTLLVRAKFVVSGSFGDIGGALYGPWMRYCILVSIVVSQIGFVCAYMIFVSENLQAFVAALTNCAKILPLPYFIFVQAIVLLPLALVRNLSRLSMTALIADAFIVAGLIYIFGSEAKIMARNGAAHVEMFNSKDFALMVGTAIFSFEGIGLVIPVTDAMREPHKFPKVLSGVMIALMFLFGGGGAMSYLTFGSDVKTVVLLNLPDSRVLQVVQFLYSAAILLSMPLQLFPAVRIMETGLFETRSGKASMRVKWTKNIFRAATVGVCSIIAYAGAADLDKFVALIGSFACVPLCYVYPPMLHLKACARTRKEKIADWALIIFGIVAAVYTTAQTLALIFEPNVPGDGSVGRCPAPQSPPTFFF